MPFFFYTVLITVQCGWRELHLQEGRKLAKINVSWAFSLTDKSIISSYNRPTDRLAAPPAIILATTRIKGDWRETFIPLRRWGRVELAVHRHSPWLDLAFDRSSLLGTAISYPQAQEYYFATFVQLTCDSPASPFVCLAHLPSLSLLLPGRSDCHLIDLMNAAAATAQFIRSRPLFQRFFWSQLHFVSGTEENMKT